jgi:excisionase family DNA binding protein
MKPIDNEEQTADHASGGLLDKSALARKLDVSKRTVDFWMKKKRLPFIKVSRTVRFVWSDVLAALKRYEVN